MLQQHPFAKSGPRVTRNLAQHQSFDGVFHGSDDPAGPVSPANVMLPSLESSFALYVFERRVSLVRGGTWNVYPTRAC